ncbi:MAG: hypothetical protein M3483_06160, partial [Gemmatimonadota bacterium]|nr:hypothetical protein [Gemmatimonadota bacterium]
MSQRLSDYFALEVGEYLEHLDALLAAPGAPDFDRLFRLARGVRGSARLAEEGQIAAVGERLEEASRAFRDGAEGWNEEMRARAIRTVDDLKVLVRARGSWGPPEEARAGEAVSRWQGIGGDRNAPAVNLDQQASLLPFLRREVTGVVCELEQALVDLRQDPEEREPLRRVIRAMRPLRGVSGVATLAPLQEILEGIEDTARQLVGGLPLADAHRTLLAEAAPALERALSAMTGATSAAGEPGMESFREALERVAE